MILGLPEACKANAIAFDLFGWRMRCVVMCGDRRNELGTGAISKAPSRNRNGALQNSNVQPRPIVEATTRPRDQGLQAAVRGH